MSTATMEKVQKALKKPEYFEIPANAPFGIADPDLPFAKLNPPQHFFKGNFRTDMNCAFQAGTGTGKRGVLQIAARAFMLTGEHVIVTAPSKQLVRELRDECVATWGSAVVGVNSGEDKDIAGKMLIVTTPEGYLSAYRQKKEWTRSGLMVVDECDGMFNVQRGPAVDASITLFRASGGRVLMMSGTFPCVEEVAAWLDADRYRCLWVRTKLTKEEIHAPADIDAKKAIKGSPINQEYAPTMSGYLFNRKSKRIKAVKEVIAKHQDDKGIIFVVTKADGYILEEVLCAPFFNADLEEEDQKKIIDDFKDGPTKLLIATSGLSRGVNTPADYVVNAGTRRGQEYLTLDDILQCQGRAGRAKDSACVYIIGDMLELCNARQSVFAQSLPLATEHMALSLLSWEPVSAEMLFKALKETFAGAYASDVEVQASVTKYLNYLAHCKLAEEESGMFRLNKEGWLIARYCIAPSDYMKYIKIARLLDATTSMGPISRGAILVSLCVPMYGGDCPPKQEKDFAMQLIDLDLDSDVSAKKAGLLKYYVEHETAVPYFFGGQIRDLRRWLSLLNDMVRYQVHSSAPGAIAMDSIRKILEKAAAKSLERKKSKNKKARPKNPGATGVYEPEQVPV